MSTQTCLECADPFAPGEGLPGLCSSCSIAVTTSTRVVRYGPFRRHGVYVWMLTDPRALALEGNWVAIRHDPHGTDAQAFVPASELILEAPAAPVCAEEVPTREAVDAEEGALIAEYTAWLTATGRPEAGCASELLSSFTFFPEECPSTEEERRWLADFITRWEAWERRSHARYLADKQEAR